MATNAAPEPNLARADAVEALVQLVRDDMRAVDQIIHDRMTSPVGMIPNLAAYLIDSGGKRIRPMITIAAARLFGGGGDAPRKLAAAVEFIHTATLLHDDVVDESALRRGRAPANRVWGNPASVLVGDFLFARSFNLMVEAGDLAVLDVLARASSIIAEGEVMQLAAANDADTSMQAYLQIVDAKTAALFAAAARVGAMAAGKPGGPADALADYGRALGLAFQLVDDALDYGGRAATMGKNVGDDFREGKITMPVIFAREAGDDEERAFWRRVMSAPQKQEDDDFDRALALLRERNGINRTLEAAREYAVTAQRALAGAPDNDFKTALTDLADFVVDRAY
ncbi:MAG TPA: polyprenyl synthetase family protein [Caulobacterales bacterium]|nr:polyprenyl synthetase family protein [Caulobacterales bacterium]